MGVCATISEIDFNILSLISGEINGDRLPFVRGLGLCPYFSTGFMSAFNHPNAFITIVAGIPFIGLE